MKQPARDLLRRLLGSRRAQTLAWRDMWAIVATKRGRKKKRNALNDEEHDDLEGKVYGESFSKSPGFSMWGSSVRLWAEVPLVSSDEATCFANSTSAPERRRANFCDRYEGYGGVCSCADPLPVADLSKTTNDPLQTDEVPVAIIASNRPQYLYRMLRSLLSARGANPEMVTVFIDGFYAEPLAVAKLFGLRGVQHTPIGNRNARITQHYRVSSNVTSADAPCVPCLPIGSYTYLCSPGLTF